MGVYLSGRPSDYKNEGRNHFSLSTLKKWMEYKLQITRWLLLLLLFYFCCHEQGYKQKTHFNKFVFFFFKRVRQRHGKNTGYKGYGTVKSMSPSHPQSLLSIVATFNQFFLMFSSKTILCIYKQMHICMCIFIYKYVNLYVDIYF